MNFVPFLLVQFLKVIPFLLHSILIVFYTDDAFKFCLVSKFHQLSPTFVPKTLKKDTKTR